LQNFTTDIELSQAEKELDQAHSTFGTCHSVSSDSCDHLFTCRSIVTLEQEWKFLDEIAEVTFEIVQWLRMV
jgi:hypothetical protein